MILGYTLKIRETLMLSLQIRVHLGLMILDDNDSSLLPLESSVVPPSHLLNHHKATNNDKRDD